MTDGKDTAAKTKPLISKENALNRPETIQRGQVLGVSAFREQIGNSAAIRRCPLCPVCRNISRENGRSFLEIADGRNITHYKVVIFDWSAGAADLPYLCVIRDFVSKNTKWYAYYHDDTAYNSLNNAMSNEGIEEKYEVNYIPAVEFWDQI